MDHDQVLELRSSRRRLLLLAVVCLVLAVGAGAIVLLDESARASSSGGWAGLAVGLAGVGASWRYLDRRGALLTACVVAVLVAVVVVGDADVLLGLGVVLFGLGGPLLLRQALDDTPLVRVDDRGVHLRERPWTEPRAIPWSQVAGFSIVSVQGTHLVAVHGDGAASSFRRPWGTADDVLAMTGVARPAAEVEAFVEAAEAYRRRLQDPPT